MALLQNCCLPSIWEAISLYHHHCHVVIIVVVVVIIIIIISLLPIHSPTHSLTISEIPESGAKGCPNSEKVGSVANYPKSGWGGGWGAFGCHRKSLKAGGYCRKRWKMQGGANCPKKWVGWGLLGVTECLKVGGYCRKRRGGCKLSQNVGGVGAFWCCGKGLKVAGWWGPTFRKVGGWWVKKFSLPPAPDGFKWNSPKPTPCESHIATSVLTGH